MFLRQNSHFHIRIQVLSIYCLAFITQVYLRRLYATRVKQQNKKIFLMILCCHQVVSGRGLRVLCCHQVGSGGGKRVLCCHQVGSGGGKEFCAAIKLVVAEVKSFVLPSSW